MRKSNFWRKNVANFILSGPLKNDEGELVQEPDRNADLLCLQYSSVYRIPSEKPSSSHTVVPVTIEDIKFDIADIAQAIDTLNPSAAAGFDGFHAQFLKKCRDTPALSIPLFVFGEIVLTNKKPQVHFNMPWSRQSTKAKV